MLTKWRLRNLSESLQKEIFFSIHGFIAIVGGNFSQVEENWGRDAPDWKEVQLGGDPYYWCARFDTRTKPRRIPVPILLNWHRKENRVQKLVIKLAGLINPANYRNALEECTRLVLLDEEDLKALFPDQF